MNRSSYTHAARPAHSLNRSTGTYTPENIESAAPDPPHESVSCGREPSLKAKEGEGLEGDPGLCRALEFRTAVYLVATRTPLNVATETVAQPPPPNYRVGLPGSESVRMDIACTIIYSIKKSRLST